MTREEAIEVFKTEHPYNPKRKDNDLHTLAKAFDLAISALSTEGEYIKKSELLQHVMTEELSDYKDCDVIHAEVIDSLQTYSFPDSDENKGEWIYKNPFDTLPYCSKCDKEPDVEILGILPNTCPNCGADMRKPKKSCTTCVNSDDELSGECYECVKGIQNHFREATSEERESVDKYIESISTKTGRKLDE